MAFAHCGEYEEDILDREARNPGLACRLFLDRLDNSAGRAEMFAAALKDFVDARACRGVSLDSDEGARPHCGFRPESGGTRG